MTESRAAVGIIGLGEVGSTLAAEVVGQGWPVVALDTRTDRGARPPSVDQNGVALLSDPAEFGRRVSVVMVTVPGYRCAEVARSTAARLRAGTVYADWTSKSPEQRDLVQGTCEAAGLPFCDVAILGTVTWPDRDVPLLLSGSGSRRTAEYLTGTRFACRIIDGAPQSAEVKLLRSAFTKGLTALLAETMAASELAGVRSVVEESITEFMNSGFERISQLLLSSSVLHARRRAEEAAEVNAMMGEILADPVMSRATATLLANLEREVARASDADPIRSADEAVRLLATLGGSA